MKEKACSSCKTIYEGEKCPHCGEGGASENYKGEAVIFNPEKSLIAKNLNVNFKGRVAIKSR